MTVFGFLSRSMGARVLLVLGGTAGLLVAASGPTFATPAAHHQPDLELGGTAICCDGLGTYESWPDEQRFAAPVKHGGYVKLFVTVGNAGNTTDSFRITGEGSYSGVHVHYFAGRSGDHEITAAVVHTGYVVPNVLPHHGIFVMRIRVSAPAAPVGFFRTVRVIARSLAVPEAMDAVSFQMTVTKTCIEPFCP